MYNRIVPKVISTKSIFFVKLVTFAYLVSYFIYRSRTPFPSFNFTDVTLILEIALVFTLFFLGVAFDIRHSRYMDRPAFLIGTILLFLILLSHSLVLESIYGDSNTFGRVFNLIRMYIYISATLIFAKYYFNRDVFLKYLYKFSFLVSAVSLALYFINPYWFSDLGYGTPRPSFLLSEPSAFAPIVVFLFFYSLQTKKFLGLFLAIALVYLLQSGVVYVVFLATLLAYLTVIQKKILIVIMLLLVPLFFYLASTYEDLKENNYVVQRLDHAIANTDFESSQGGTARIITLINLHDELEKDARYYFGRGLNTAKVFFGLEWEYREFSLVHLFLFSFGVIGLALFLAILLLTYIHLLLSDDVIMMIAFASFTSASLINSASGTVLHKFCYLFVFVVLFRALKSSRIVGLSKSISVS